MENGKFLVVGIGYLLVPVTELMKEEVLPRKAKGNRVKPDVPRDCGVSHEVFHFLSSQTPTK